MIQNLDVNVSHSIDWAKLSGVTKVKDQGGCRSCYAFSALGVFEKIELSEQNLVDYSGDGGCM